MTGPHVYGAVVDSETRCTHYQSVLDIIAIRFRCCDRYYPCFSCHEEAAAHPPQRWPRSEWEQKAVLCGACKTELSINHYLECGNECPHCGSAFNPGCRHHYHLYFETESEKG